MIQRLTAKAFSWMDRLGNLPPFQVALGALIWALVLLLISAMVEVFDFAHEGRQVGYVVTLNWSIGFTLVAPFFYYFLLLAYQEAAALPEKLSVAQMLRRSPSEVHPTGAAVVAGKWTSIRRKAAAWWLGISFLGLVESLWEWWVYSGRPLLKGGLPREQEIDWSVKFLDGEALDSQFNSAFSLLVFFQQALLISMIGLLLCMVLAFTLLVRDLRRSGRAVRLFPSVSFETEDNRRGFQVFSRFFQLFLTAGVCLYAHFLLSRLWNVYLRSPESKGMSLWKFIRGLFLEGMERATTWKKEPSQLSERVVELLKDLGALDFSGLFVSLGAVLLFLISLVLLLVVLRGAAEGGRDELLNAGARGAAKERLRGMTLWPMNYPSLNTLVLAGFLGLTGMIAYRVAVLFLGLAAGLALSAAVKQFFRR